MITITDRPGGTVEVTCTPSFNQLQHRLQFGGASALSAGDHYALVCVKAAHKALEDMREISSAADSINAMPNAPRRIIRPGEF